jgi:hypothetical protein
MSEQLVTDDDDRLRPGTLASIWRRFGYLSERIHALECAARTKDAADDPIIVRTGEHATVMRATGPVELLGPVARSFFQPGDIVQFGFHIKEQR